MSPGRSTGRWLAAALLAMMPGLQQGLAAQAAAPAELRSIPEGTWDLEEWHAEGHIMRPPEMTGRWMVHDGVVMAIRHRRPMARSSANIGSSNDRCRHPRSSLRAIGVCTCAAGMVHFYLTETAT